MLSHLYNRVLKGKNRDRYFMANTTLVRSPQKRVLYTDYLKRYEEKGLLGMDNEQKVRQCLYSICTLIHDHLTESGRHAYLNLPSIADGVLTLTEVESLRIEVWESSEKLLNDTKQYSAMKALLCSLYDSSVHRNSYYDVLSCCIRFSMSAAPDTAGQAYINILRDYFEPLVNN